MRLTKLKYTTSGANDKMMAVGVVGPQANPGWAGNEYACACLPD